jgi:hypothetical protein
MGMKCIGILMVVTIKLYILIVSTSFAYSALIMLPQFFELDKAQKPENQEPTPLLHSCITKKYDNCKESEKNGARGFSYSECLFNGFMDCLDLFKHSTVIESCVLTCWRQHTIDKHPLHLVWKNVMKTMSITTLIRTIHTIHEIQF